MQKNDTSEIDQMEGGDALVIKIQSRATIIIGIVALVLGLMVGFIARPSLATIFNTSTSGTDSTPVPEVVSPDNEASVKNQSSVDENVGDDQPVSPSIAALVSQAMDRARHFVGDPDAPVTIIEFGDFQ
jgi:protein-disulfide isomerase